MSGEVKHIIFCGFLWNHSIFGSLANIAVKTTNGFQDKVLSGHCKTQRLKRLQEPTLLLNKMLLWAMWEVDIKA